MPVPRPHCERFPRVEKKEISGEYAIEAGRNPPAKSRVRQPGLAPRISSIAEGVMMGMLARAGAELTRHAEDADVIVVNTCSFIDSAQQESVNTILEIGRHNGRGPREKASRSRMPG